jgi:hypothetical protein
VKYSNERSTSDDAMRSTHSNTTSLATNMKEIDVVQPPYTVVFGQADSVMTGFDVAPDGTQFECWPKTQESATVLANVLRNVEPLSEDFIPS